MKLPSLVRAGYCLFSSHSNFSLRSSHFFSTYSNNMSSHKFVIHPFCLRQFVGVGSNGARVGSSIPMEAADFEKKVNEIFEQGGIELKDGYAPFW